MQLSMSPFLQLRSSGVCLFVSVYFFLFLIASVVLFSPIFRTSLDHRPISTNRNSRSVFSEDDYEWENSLFLNLSGFSSLSGAPRGLRWPVTSPGPINCSTLNEVKDLEFIAAGWTKAVYKGMFRGEPVAIKTVNLNGHDFRQCQERQPQASLASCYRRTAAKLLKELILLTELSHENIIKVFLRVKMVIGRNHHLWTRYYLSGCTRIGISIPPKGALMWHSRHDGKMPPNISEFSFGHWRDFNDISLLVTPGPDTWVLHKGYNRNAIPIPFDPLNFMQGALAKHRSKVASFYISTVKEKHAHFSRKGTSQLHTPSGGVKDR
ncbi:hypothetical protein J6590_040045 [Homalodisca vitripennis]|nr:hypothetical protein J6590_040045 [Homalodisca vitripennis]